MSRRHHRNQSISLHAQPYDISANGWYFKSASDWVKKFQSHLPVEEYEIQFIDGPDAARALFDAMGVNQVSVEEYFERLSEIKSMREDELAALHYALHGLGLDFGEALRLVEDEIRVTEGHAKEYVEEMIDDQGGVGALGRETIERYFDYEAFGRDLGFDLDSDDPDDARWIEMSDEERGEAYIEEKGIDHLFDKPRDKREAPVGERYFDVDAYARGAELNGEVVEFRYAGKTWTTSYVR